MVEQEAFVHFEHLPGAGHCVDADELGLVTEFLGQGSRLRPRSAHRRLLH